MAGWVEKMAHPDVETGGRRRAPEESAARPGGQPDRRGGQAARQRDPASFRENVARFHRSLGEGYAVLNEAHDRWKKYTQRKNMLPTQVETEKAKEKEICQNALKIFLEVDTDIREIYTPILEYIMRHVDESEKAKDESLKEKVLESRWDGRGRVAIALFKQTSLALGFLAAFVNEEDQDEGFQARYREVVAEQKARLDTVPFSAGAYTKLGQAMRRAADHRSFDQMTRLSFQIVQEYLESPSHFMKKYADACKNPVPTELTT